MYTHPIIKIYKELRKQKSNTDTKCNIGSKYTSFILIPIGILAIFLGLLSIIYNYNFINNSYKTIGTVISSNSDRITIEYDCNGKTYKNKNNASTNPYPKKGSILEVYCSKEDPNSFLIKDFMNFYFLSIFLIFFGSIPLTLGIIILNTYKKENEIKKYFKEDGNGKKIKGKIKDIITGKVIINKIPSINIVCEYNDGTNNFTFTSNCILVDNINHIAYFGKEIGNEIDIYIDYNNYEKYLVDVDSLYDRIKENIF